MPIDIDRENIVFVLALYEKGLLSSETVLDAIGIDLNNHPKISEEEIYLNNYLIMMSDLKLDRIREQIPHYSIMWLEV